MPCYVNIGAYIDEGTMIDTFAKQEVVVRLEKTVISPLDLELVEF